MRPEDALKVMCRNCKNYEMCQGTGCNPKAEIALAIKRMNNFDKLAVKCLKEINQW